MKKFGYSSLMAFCIGLSIITGCDKNRLNPVEDKLSEVVFTFADGAGMTKTTSTAAETAVSEWCLYIVDSNDNVFDAVSVSSQSVTRNLPDGSYTAYAAVNCGLSAGSFNTANEIKAYQCSLADETSVFSMFGSETFTVSNGARCTIPVHRLVSRVSIGKVSVDFSQHPDLAAKTFTLDKIYLINVPAKSQLENSTSFSPSVWYNKRGYVSGEASSLLYDNVGATLTSSSPHNTAHYFYCYQNNSTSDSHASTWSARHTRLVLECSIGGSKTYYPIDIAGTDSRLARNSLYTINEVKITNLGSNGPDEPIEGPVSIYFNATVTTWEGTYTVNENF